MSNKNYINGVKKERKLVNEARDSGKLAFRSAGSHSPIDVFILDVARKQIRLVQCKPKSMSDNKKEALRDTLKHFIGTYDVIVEVC